MRGALVSLGVWLCIHGCTAEPPVVDGGAILDARPDDVGAADAAMDGSAEDAAGGDASGTAPRRVLFVGNSYTNYNDLPSVVRDLSAGRDDVAPLEVEAVLVDGATLWQHWTTTGARERLETGDFDVVVLQGQSTEPIRDAVDGSTGFSFAAQNFIGAATAVGTEVVFYVTWARRADSPDYERLGLGDPTAMTNALESGYWGVAGWLADDAAYAHVGLAFQIAIAELPEVELYAPDASHPSSAGSFLAACVLSEMIAGEYPRVPPVVPLGLDPDVAEALCAIAPRVACAGTTPGAFCHGDCVRTDRDALHCGACDAVCPDDLPCMAGTCACPYPDQTACPGRYCTDPERDTYNCGTCGHVCEAGQLCQGGTCVCTNVSRIEVPSGRLTELRAGCARGSATADLDCAAAIAEHCGSLSCFESGVALTPFPAMAPSVLCIAGEPTTTTIAELAALEPGCTGIDVLHGPACATAIHRSCAAAGSVSGLPATPSDATRVTASCFPSATVVRTTFTQLASTLSFCDGTTVRSGIACTAASAWTCQAMGHAGGFGPVEAALDDVDIVCVDD